MFTLTQLDKHYDLKQEQIMSNLQKHIDAENARRREWMAAGEDRWCGMIPDADHYVKQGIFTVEEMERYDMISTISDLAKAAYGTRAACPDTDGMSFTELSATYDSMLVDLEHAEKHEQAYQAECIARFEKSVADTIAMGASDRETAVRWLREAEQDEDSLLNNDYFEYDQNLPYGYLKKVVA